jgi:hypothetical protein
MATPLSITRANGATARIAAMLAATLLLAAGVLAAAAGPADAACACRCVNGKAKAVCSSGTDIPPLCNNTRCPLSTPKPSPLDVSKPKPPVMPGCKVQQVYNPQTGKHEWGQLCH